MTENEFLLIDRIQKIQQIIGKYEEENFYISFSGGKDSVALSALFDEALPGNHIPRVYFNTGIEFNMMVEFVRSMAEKDPRIEIIAPSTPIKQMLEKEGYPFKSKEHSKRVKEYQANMRHSNTTYNYSHRIGHYAGRYGCPVSLSFQFAPDYPLKISDKCCDRLKKDIDMKYREDHGITWAVTGIMAAEGGARTHVGCIVENKKKFHPLFPVSPKWVDWYIQERDLQLCSLYYPPYNFERTGCKGCPYNIHIQDELDALQEYLPAERKQCEIIWAPVYAEYRRLGYRLRPDTTIPGQISIEDYLKEVGNG